MWIYNFPQDNVEACKSYRLFMFFDLGTVTQGILVNSAQFTNNLQEVAITEH
jgi:hypothetical protein